MTENIVAVVEMLSSIESFLGTKKPLCFPAGLPFPLQQHYDISLHRARAASLQRGSSLFPSSVGWSAGVLSSPPVSSDDAVKWDEMFGFMFQLAT